MLGGPKKVDAEALERIYAAAPQIQEIAVLERDGAMDAMLHPDHAKLLEMGATNIHDGIRVVLAERARDLPSARTPFRICLDKRAAAPDPGPANIGVSSCQTFMLGRCLAAFSRHRIRQAQTIWYCLVTHGGSIWSLLRGANPAAYSTST